MAFLHLKFHHAFVIMLLFCFLVMEEASGCNNGYWCFHAKEASHHEIQNRKVLAAGMKKEKKEGFFVGVHMHEASSSGNEEGKVVGWELRKVPSGPDPLHHNGRGPKKPQTP